MDKIQKEFLDIVTQVRTHLELNHAFGVSVLETHSPEGHSPVPDASPVRTAPDIKEHEKKPSPSAPKTGLAGIVEDAQACTGCKLGKSRTRIVFGEGNPHASLVFVGTAPGKEEDDLGKPFVDAAGKLLTDIIVKGMQLRREDVYVSTLLKCRLPDDRDPDAGELEACEQFLVRQLEAIKPKIIIVLGGPAASALLKTNQGIEALRGRWHQYRGVKLMPTFDPARLLANPADKKAVWEDIKMVMAELEKLKKA